MKIRAGTGGRFETTDKVTIRIIQKIIALISSLFPAINHVIIRILAFFRTCVFLESDFNDFFSGFGTVPCPTLDGDYALFAIAWNQFIVRQEGKILNLCLCDQEAVKGVIVLFDVAWSG